MRRRAISCGIVATIAGLVLSACGSGSRQDVHEPSGKFPVQVTTATFPPSQQISEHTTLRITIRNAGVKTIPDIAVTICNVTCTYPAPPGEGTSAEAFAEWRAAPNQQPYLSNPSRPVWIIDATPGPCGYSCIHGGPGSGPTAYSNTWALGALKPGGIATFRWALTPVAPGHHIVAWQVAAGLNGKARAVLTSGLAPQGTFTVNISSAPAQSYVNNAGQVVTKP